MKLIFEQVRLVDHSMDRQGSLVVEDGHIREIYIDEGPADLAKESGAAIHIDCSGTDWVLMPAFVDLHAHFRDPGFPEKESLESASLAAASGGFGTVVCMANTKPVIDNLDLARQLQSRAERLGLIDLFPVLSLSRNMEGRDTDHLEALDAKTIQGTVRLLSEDGKDVADDRILRKAFQEARRLGLPVSSHCDWGGKEAEDAKNAGLPRSIWSRLEENLATERVLALAAETGIHIHIAHVSTKEAVELIRKARKGSAAQGFRLTCEATPHHLDCTEEIADQLGPESYGRVNPPLRTAADIGALIEAVQSGTIDAIATDHAPHTEADKTQGAPGFIGLETAFAVCYTALVLERHISLKKLSALMSRNPSRILRLEDRGFLAPWARADLVLVDLNAQWTVQKDVFRSRSSNSPFIGKQLQGRVLMTIHKGNIVYDTLTNYPRRIG
ncbi:dihydroorotase [Gracilinema caldarium]|uniref:dihydroorotase n=1 Tax=Gracilinema caldarium TaxID=215591 RepID=UPI0026EA8951|nr:dihydroorotase [Gracilinema caldarium]